MLPYHTLADDFDRLSIGVGDQPTPAEQSRRNIAGVLHRHRVGKHVAPTVAVSFLSEINGFDVDFQFANCAGHKASLCSWIDWLFTLKTAVDYRNAPSTAACPHPSLSPRGRGLYPLLPLGEGLEMTP